MDVLSRFRFTRCVPPALIVPLSLAVSALADTPAPTASSAPPSTATAAAAAAPSDAKTSAIENAVVKVFSTVRRPDPYKPWTKFPPRDISGSGVIIEGRRILTNAHVVLYASQIQVQANQSGDRVSATIEAIAPGIDLAVLKLDDESFFASRPPIPHANTLPDVKEPVLAYGYPTGGTSLSITKGIVSRIEFTNFNLSTSGLRIQIDAAINHGNSGGPAVSGDKMIGLAFGFANNTQNIGYIIPNEEIDLFLADIADGKYDGKPEMFDDFQTLENPTLRSFLGVGKDVQGAVVTEPYVSDASYPLKRWDVVTKIGDAAIDDEGMVKISENLRVRFQYLVQKIAKNGKVPLTVVRGGKMLSVELPVGTDRALVLPALHGNYPSYFIFGPVVFSTATAEFLDGLFGNANVSRGLTMNGSPLTSRRGDKPAFPDERLVVVSSPFFPHKIVRGYSPAITRVVDQVNGTRIKNLEHLVQVLHDAKGDFVVIEFAERRGEQLALPRQECIASTEAILADNGIRSQGSPDVMKIWEQK